MFTFLLINFYLVTHKHLYTRITFTQRINNKNLYFYLSIFLKVLQKPKINFKQKQREIVINYNNNNIFEANLQYFIIILQNWLNWKFMEVPWCSMVYVWYCFSSQTSLRRYWLINRKHSQVLISFWWVICIKWFKSVLFLLYHWFWFLWLLLLKFYMKTKWIDEWMNKVSFFKIVSSSI